MRIKLIAAALVAASCATAHPEELHRTAFREMISIRAGIEPGDSDREVAEKFTRHIYQATLFGGRPWAVSGNDALRYVHTVEHKVANMCATLTSTTIWALGLFGIPARAVSFAAEEFVTGEDIAPTHTLVEAKVDGQNLVFDPTFNALYKCAGSDVAVDAATMLSCARADKIEPIYLSTPRQGRSLEEYAFSLHEMSFAIEASERPEEFYILQSPQKGWLEEARKLYR